MNIDDPKLTAYALDELDPAGRAEIEQLLRDDPAATAELQATRDFAAQLRTRLHAERAEGLHPAQRAEILASAAIERPRNVIAFSRRVAVWSALAASVVIGVGIALLFPVLSSMKNPSLVAKPRANSAPIGTITDGSQVKVRLEPEALAAIEESPQPQPGGEAPPTLAVTQPASSDSRPGFPALAVQNPALPPAEKSVASKENVDRLLAEAQAFYDSARYDLAFKRGEQVLALDTYNIAARKLEEKINLQRDHYANSAFDEARSRAIWQTDVAWANPVRKFTGAQATTASKAAASSSLGVSQPVTTTLSVRGFNPMTESERDHFASNRQSGGYRGASVPAETKANSLYKDESKPTVLSTMNRERELSDLVSDPSGSESYDDVTDNAFLKVTDAPLSTFSIDVDTASYANVRRFLNGNTLPPRAAVRIEELVNYFHYDYPQPDGDTPFSAAMEIAGCPWTPEHRLLRVALHGRDIARAARPASNLIFLIDVSGSMEPENKLPLLKRSLALMVDQLSERDQVGIVVYAGAAGCVLESTHSKDKIRAALDRLESGGSTHGSAGIQLAYELAEKHFIKGGTNRVILATDGDWNVGVTDKGDLWKMIERKAKGGVFLTVLGFGMDNLKDDMLEKLADKGNGNYAYIDTLNEGRKVLVDELGATLVTIAKDVKIQIEFNPAQVGAYRLIGYENRVMAAKDFADDTKDAGEIGAGHSVTAFYEIIPAGTPMPAPAIEPLKYQPAPIAKDEKPETRNQKPETSDELLTLKLRYKAPDGDVSTLREFPFKDAGRSFAQSTRDFRFAAAVAGYGMMLRDSPHKGGANWALVHELAIEGKGEDRDGYRAEFVGLVEKARAMMR